MLAAMSSPQPRARDDDLKLHRSAAFGEVSIAPCLSQEPVNMGSLPPGSVVAPNYITIGGPADLAPTTGRGGARNLACRLSYALTPAQVANLTAGAAYAADIGLPFTRMITIHWRAAGVALADMARATGRFVDLLAKTLARHGVKTAWLWVHENGDGKGWHCHLLAYVPGNLVPVVARLQRGWLRRITGRPYRAKVIYSEPIGGRLGLEVSNPPLHAINLKTVVGYVLKGANLEAALRFALERLVPGGLVIGKRCGTSQNIGSAARKASA